MTYRLQIEKKLTLHYYEMELITLKAGFSSLDDAKAFLPLLGINPESTPARVFRDRGVPDQAKSSDWQLYASYGTGFSAHRVFEDQVAWESPAYLKARQLRESIPGTHYWHTLQTKPLQKKADAQRLSFTSAGVTHSFSYLLGTDCATTYRTLTICYRTSDGKAATFFNPTEYIASNGNFLHQRFAKAFPEACKAYREARRQNLGVELLSTSRWLNDELQNITKADKGVAEAGEESYAYWNAVRSLLWAGAGKVDYALKRELEAALEQSTLNAPLFMSWFDDPVRQRSFAAIKLGEALDRELETCRKIWHSDITALRNAAVGHSGMGSFLRQLFQKHFERSAGDPDYNSPFGFYSWVHSCAAGTRRPISLVAYSERPAPGRLPDGGELFHFKDLESAEKAATLLNNEYWRICDREFCPSVRVDSAALQAHAATGNAMTGSPYWRFSQIEALIASAPPFVHELPSLGLSARGSIKFSPDRLNQENHCYSVSFHVTVGNAATGWNDRQWETRLDSYITSDDRLLRSKAWAINKPFFEAWKKETGCEFLDTIAAWYRPLFARFRSILSQKPALPSPLGLEQIVNAVSPIVTGTMKQYAGIVQVEQHLPGCRGNLELTCDAARTLCRFSAPFRLDSAQEEELVAALAKNYHCDCQLLQAGQPS